MKALRRAVRVKLHPQDALWAIYVAGWLSALGTFYVLQVLTDVILGR